MTTIFERRVIKEGIVDTAKYRYVYREYGYRAEIVRLPIEYLDTTKVADGWEVVKEYQ